MNKQYRNRFDEGGSDKTQKVDINKIIQQALEKSRTRTEPKYLTLKDIGLKADPYDAPYTFFNPIENSWTTVRMRDMDNIFKDMATKGIYDKSLIKDYKETLEDYRTMPEDELYGRINARHPNLSNCITTALDNYDIKCIGNQTFASNPNKYHFREINKDSIQPGDFVQTNFDDIGNPHHGVIFNGYDENGNMRFNYSDGGGHYKVNAKLGKEDIKTIKVYRYTGNNNKLGYGGLTMLDKELDIRSGGTAIPLGNNLVLIQGNKHNKGDKRTPTDIKYFNKGGGVKQGNKLEVEGGEVEQILPGELRVFSARPILNGVSPAQLVLNGANPYEVFSAQQSINGNKDVKETSTKAGNGIVEKVLDWIGIGNKENNNKEQNIELTKEEQNAIKRENMASRQLYMESNYGLYKKSDAGARGLMQIMPNTVEEVNRIYGTNYTINDMDDDDKNIDVYNKYMDYLYQRPYLTKGSDSIIDAKVLAAYNAGPTKIKNDLEKQKAKGIDIYNSWDWLNGLDSEPRDYVNFGLRNIDIKNSDKINDLYNKRRESNKELDEKVRQSTRKKQQLGGKTQINNMYKDRINNGKLLFTINPIPTGSQKLATFKNGGRVKADLGSAAMWSNMGLGLANTLIQGITGSVIGRKISDMYKSLTRESTYIPVARDHIVYSDQSNAKRDAVRRSTDATNRNITVNTNSSKVARNSIGLNNMNQSQSLAEIENYEIGRRDQARNAEAELQAKYNLTDNQNKINDIRENNDFETQRTMGITNAKTQALSTWGNAIAQGLQTIGTSVSDYAKMNYNLMSSENQTAVNTGVLNNSKYGYRYNTDGTLKDYYRNKYYNSDGTPKSKYANKKGIELNFVFK